MLVLLFLLLPIAAMSGWYFGCKHSSFAKKAKRSFFLPSDYFIGLRYLINEQPDKAVDVFIKMLEVNSDTIETHLALGGLFRRRGEVNRAIKIHQNLIERQQISKKQRIHALYELAQDYLRAGVLDRSEKLFLELIELGRETEESFRSLLNIYELQKDWKQAITISKKLSDAHKLSMQTQIAHYFCELGNAKKALEIDKNCVRANLMQGNYYIEQKKYSSAICEYKKSINQNADFISEIIQPMAFCYEKLGKEEEFIKYLEECFKKYSRISIALALTVFIKKYQDNFAAIEFITKHIEQYPSLRGLNCLAEIYVDNSEEKTKNKLLLLQEIMNKLLSSLPKYRCFHCGFSGKSLFWQCPGCKRWGEVKPIHDTVF